MDLQLRDRVVLVVGGTGLIGSAIVQRARDEGATVVVASRRGGDGIVMDARENESVAAGVAHVLEQYGRLDAAVVTAAPSARTLDPNRNSDPAQVAEGLDAKTLVFLRVVSAVIPAMRDAGFGRIVGVSGQNAFITGNVTGSVRNAALIITAKNLADEVAGTGITVNTVNTVNPGIVSDTPATAVEPGKPGESSPAQIADLVAFLISPLASTSGESIAVGHRVRGVVSF